MPKHNVHLVEQSHDKLLRNYEWIKPEDRLPEINVMVLMLVPSWHPVLYTGYHDGERWYDADGVETGGGHNSPEYWMDLPELPIKIEAPTGAIIIPSVR